MKPESDHTIDEGAGSRCLAYLLGELPDQEAATFEQQLADSPELCDELANQSNILCHLSDISVAPPVTATKPSTPWLEAIAALAACLLIALVGWKMLGKTNSTNALEEDLLIAEAWVETDSIASFEEFELDLDREFDEAQNLDDASLSWVMTAIESGVSVDG